MVYDLPNSMKLCIVYQCVDWSQHCTQHKYDTYNLLKLKSIGHNVYPWVCYVSELIQWELGYI